MNTLPMRLVLGAVMALAALGCAGNPQEPSKLAEEKPGPPLVMTPPSGSDATKLENAVAALDRGDLPRALRTLEDLRSRHPENGLVLHELAIGYRIAKKPEE